LNEASIAQMLCIRFLPKDKGFNSLACHGENKMLDLPLIKPADLHDRLWGNTNSPRKPVFREIYDDWPQ
jgi:hypothetical protein